MIEKKVKVSELVDSLNSSDILENKFKELFPDIFEVLLLDRTLSSGKRKKNIIWGNDHYLMYGSKHFNSSSQIKPELITGVMSNIIKPRALKAELLKKERTKLLAEVFTPLWLVKKQNDIAEKSFKGDDLLTYVKRLWLEITCGEAPYMVTRYDMETGSLVNLLARVGFLDRKLQRINNEIEDFQEWQILVEEAYKSCYGFEWSGDSLLLARENLFYSYLDYFYYKWCVEPDFELMWKIAEIISYNVFQMDGTKYIIPLSDQQKIKTSIQISLFEDEKENNQNKIENFTGKRVKIMNWKRHKMEYFDNFFELGDCND